MKFISFGNGSSGNCYYIASEKTAILIDAGISIRKIKRYFKDYGIKPSMIKAILITHDHADHIKAAGCISNEFFIPVYTTELIHKGMQTSWELGNWTAAKGYSSWSQQCSEVCSRSQTQLSKVPGGFP